VSKRTLAWDGCVNVRDLGGLPTEGGRTTRFGRVIRADSVRRLTDDGWSALVAAGVSRIIDLRVASELDSDPSRDVPVEVTHVPVLPEVDAPEWAEIDAIGDAAPNQAAATRDVYLEFLTRYGANFARAIAAVAEPSDGAVVVHCAAGKDRTGLVVALLLRLAGVASDDVAADYATSAANLRREIDEWVADAPDETERRRRVRIGATPAAAMVGVLAEVERRHGSVASYLARAGMSDRDIERARARLVD
jgi:protein tyrosine/serine phosphatase